MDIVIGDLLTIEGEKYITLEKLTYENNDYIFVNKVIDENNLTEEFYIFKIVNNGIIIVESDNLRNILIPKFEELLKKDINKILEEN